MSPVEASNVVYKLLGSEILYRILLKWSHPGAEEFDKIVFVLAADRRPFNHEYSIIPEAASTKRPGPGRQ